jgi:hypothetical protein
LLSIEFAYDIEVFAAISGSGCPGIVFVYFNALELLIIAEYQLGWILGSQSPK